MAQQLALRAVVAVSRAAHKGPACLPTTGISAVDSSSSNGAACLLEALLALMLDLHQVVLDWRHSVARA